MGRNAGFLRRSMEVLRISSHNQTALDNLESQDLVSNEEDDNDYSAPSNQRMLRLTPMGKIMAHNFISYDTVSAHSELL